MRFSPRPLRIASAVSLAFLAAMIVAWVWSFIPGTPDRYVKVFEELQDRQRAEMAELKQMREREEQILKELERARGVTIPRRTRVSPSSRVAGSLPPLRWVRLWSADTSTFFLASSRGIVGIVQYEYAASPTASTTNRPTLHAPGFFTVAQSSILADRPDLALGYRHSSVANINGWIVTQRRFGIHYWILCLLTLIAPGLYLWARCRDRYMIRQNRCLACGYDLRASPERCPECGTSRTTATLSSPTAWPAARQAPETWPGEAPHQPSPIDPRDSRNPRG